MSDQHPSEPGVVGPSSGGAPDAPPPDGAGWTGSDSHEAGGPVAASPTPAPPPAEPPIDLSKPEEPAPPAPVDGEPLVSAPDAERVVPVPPVPEPIPVPTAEDAPPLPPTPTPSTGPAPEPEPSGGPSGQVWKMALVVAVFLAVVMVAFLLGKKDGGKEETTSSTTSTTALDTSPVNTSSWATFTDSESGFTFKHPKEWIKLPTDGAERAVLQAGPESFAIVTVRNVSSDDAPAVIQGALEGSKFVEGGEPANEEINGLPVVRDIFETPIDADSPDPGLAVRYFVVAPTKLYMIVFVTRPPEQLNRLARTFKGVANSFTNTSDDPAPEPSSTVAPGTTPTT